jgi:AcrR family transcriptional regulator
MFFKHIFDIEKEKSGTSAKDRAPLFMDTREKILRKSESMFMKYGFRSVTMDDIAKELGISKKTLYQYVDNKADLIQQIILQFTEQQKQTIEEIRTQAGDAIEELLNLARHVINVQRCFRPVTLYDLRKYYLETWGQMERLKQEYVTRMIYENLEKGIKQGLYRDNFDPRIIARIFASKIQMLEDEELFPPSDYDKEKLFREFFLYHIHGVASPKGFEHLNQHLELEA